MAMTTPEQHKDAPENWTFKLEGWLFIAVFVVLMLIGLLAALIAPNV
jgi:type II secretory pathway pseudopilin PulG